MLVVKDLVLYSVDSGHSKIFGHSDMQYAPAIGVLGQLLKLDPKAITRSPSHLICTTQPNSFDCGYHVVLNAFSICEHINATRDADADLTTWAAPRSTPSEMRQYRKELYDKAAALPYAVVLEDGSDSEDEPSEDEKSEGEPLELDQSAMAICCLTSYKHKQLHKQTTAPRSVAQFPLTCIRTCGYARCAIYLLVSLYICDFSQELPLCFYTIFLDPLLILKKSMILPSV